MKIPLQFQWDENKNEANIEKHDLAFEEAHLIFEEIEFTRVNLHQVQGETRFFTLGTLEGLVVVLIWSRPQPHTIRVISLRKATSHERILYQNFLQDKLGESAE